ncbi:unnamed protein product [Adineta steineri]|uniref:Uncharacterized protein n=1 Tax=Adineta steineri TaxID=433720 RepID=A0A814QTN2_9BILA|nr:unnamed protein product [Adineta steineri]CAF4043030.1 unnamed protein product [Adineta steineri]
MAEGKCKRLKQQPINIAQIGDLCLSTDIWTDNYQKVSYLEATAHYINEQYRFHSVDSFCIESKAKIKSGDEMLKIRKEICKNEL